MISVYSYISGVLFLVGVVMIFFLSPEYQPRLKINYFFQSLVIKIIGLALIILSAISFTLSRIEVLIQSLE